MKFSRIDRSTYGTILLSRHSRTLVALLRVSRVARARDGCSTALLKRPDAARRLRYSPKTTSAVGCPISLTPSRCFSAAVAPPGGPTLSSGFFTHSDAPSTSRSNHTCEVAAKAHDPNEPHEPNHNLPTRNLCTKQETLELVDQYDSTSVQERFEYYRDPYRRGYAPADGPHLTVSARREDVEAQSVNSRQWRSPTEAEMVQRLERAVAIRLRHPSRIDLDEIWELYSALPAPRVSLLTARLRHQLMVVLASVERKDTQSMLRYFSAVADIRDSGFSLLPNEWNNALSFASRSVARVTETEAEAALRLWREMELSAGVRSNNVTFNILFDVASKAGKFHLAEMIYEQMRKRGMYFGRYHHVSMIHFFGLKQDGRGVRAAYKEMVEAGEIIDTIALNAVISGLIRSGEEESALRVYEKMITSNKNLQMKPVRNYTTNKAITKVLMMFSKVAKTNSSMHSDFQGAALLLPDLHTYRILVNHFGVRLGDLSRVAQFLDDMRPLNIQLHGAIFLALFKSFHLHGGPRSAWSRQRLESVWASFLNACDSGAEGLYISTQLAQAILRAFARHASRDEMLDIYRNLSSRWGDLDAASVQSVLRVLNSRLKGGISGDEYGGTWD
ncbi:hypothetical protein GGR56DRAFT_25556 [Xylariaceae sp. FL0804]|nr:hypothetical protein GGR56DRAFT_25556 [Xylariaceae sp. FL0804]